MCELSDIEKIEAKYPQLKFWGIEVNNPHFHAKIVGTDVYVNLLQPDIEKLKAMLHETVHYDFDACNLSSGNKMKTLYAEKWAVKESERRFNEIFGGSEK